MTAPPGKKLTFAPMETEPGAKHKGVNKALASKTVNPVADTTPERSGGLLRAATKRFKHVAASDKATRTSVLKAVMGVVTVLVIAGVVIGLALRHGNATPSPPPPLPSSPPSPPPTLPPTSPPMRPSPAPLPTPPPPPPP